MKLVLEILEEWKKFEFKRLAYMYEQILEEGAKLELKRLAFLGWSASLIENSNNNIYPV